jgi:hypothetical protein
MLWEMPPLKVWRRCKMCYVVLLIAWWVRLGIAWVISVTVFLWAWWVIGTALHAIVTPPFWQVLLAVGVLSVYAWAGWGHFGKNGGFRG